MYYPPSEITPNLRSTGADLVYKDTLKPYKGYYYATSDGKYYTGATFNLEAKELIKNNSNINVEITTPDSYIPIPTQDDYNKGYITRYAMKRVNSGYETIKEINQEDYNKSLSNPLYTQVSFKWKITGPINDVFYNMNLPVDGIISTNQKTLKNLESKIPGISQYFKNLVQYAK